MSERTGQALERKRGDTAPDVVLILDPETGDPLDITGFSYTLTVNVERNPADDSQQLVSIGGTLTDPVAGRVEFAWDASAADQEPGRYWYDIQQTDTAGRVKTIAKNSYRFYQDITKN